MTVYSNTGEMHVYAEAMLVPVFNSHTGPQCIVGEGVAEHSHLLQGSSGVLSGERKSEEEKEAGRQWGEKERQRKTKKEESEGKKRQRVAFHQSQEKHCRLFVGQKI